ncbi:MAG: serine/threonine protein kinase [Bdellovibrionales bacterium]|nr:serine/threonine protein kinase [Bdellovibrionales bacterium]
MKSFFDLTPNEVFAAMEQEGLKPTGEYFQLNSYENRVFQVTLEDDSKVVAKFYRPGRWELPAIIEEHEFLEDLRLEGFPVVSPLVLSYSKKTLSSYKDMFFAVFPKAMGRLPQEILLKDFSQLGKSLALLHNVGLKGKSLHRPAWSAADKGWPAQDILLPLLPSHLFDRYEEATSHILETLEDLEASAKFQRIHGDMHRANLLQTDVAGKPNQFFFMDFDDFGMGSVVQDFWMICTGDEDEANESLDLLLEGYNTLRSFNEEELALMEPLRGLRIIHYAAWIHQRWSDPSFPQIFPQFGSESYWTEELKQLEDIASGL